MHSSNPQFTQSPAARGGFGSKALGLLALAGGLLSAPAAESTVDTSNWKTPDDHQNMMKQLGIEQLRPGPSGRAKADNPANYDESIANPYPDLPEVLVLKSGEKVTSAKTWWDKRRPQKPQGQRTRRIRSRCEHDLRGHRRRRLQEHQRRRELEGVQRGSQDKTHQGHCH
jgi:hypothetical protein